MKINKVIFFFFLLSIRIPIQSQNIPDTIRTEIQEITISATKFDQPMPKVPEFIKVFSKINFENQNSTNMADILSNSAYVFIQKSQMGGGSPVLRGFEANKILLIMDGVRMNNAIYRGGHLQNIITIDGNQLDKVEILFGASSLLYGSDALGGVLSFTTKKPQLKEKQYAEPNNVLITRFNSANKERTIHFSNNTGFKKLAFITSFTYSDFSDLLTGSSRKGEYPDFGKRQYYIRRINGTDSIKMNSNPNLQIGTAYHQADFMEQILYKYNENWSSLLNIQYSTSSKIPRYDRLTETTNELPSYSEWYYGPQNRLMVSFKNELSLNNSIFDKATIICSFQNIEEDRITRRYGNANEKHQEENLNILGITADFEKKYRNNQKLQTGLDIQLNNLNSVAYNLDITDGYSKTPGTTRYPDGENQMTYMGLYSLYKKDINDNLIFTGGLRYTRTFINSNFINSDLPFNQIKVNTSDLCGSSGIIFYNNIWKFALNTGKGFRSPNIDDIAKIFNSSQGNVIIPNKDLKPEITYNFDINISKYFPNKSYLNLAVYQTLIRNVIITENGKYNGQDSIEYDGVLSQVQILNNSDRGLIRGIQLFSHFNITANFYTDGSVQYTYGRDLTNDVPLDHIPPVFGKLLSGYKYGKLNAEIWTIFNSWKKIENFSPSGEDNAIYATPEGSPAWATLNMRLDYMIDKHLRLQLAVENIFDIHYRQFASGISAAGRNFILTLRFKI